MDNCYPTLHVYPILPILPYSVIQPQQQVPQNGPSQMNIQPFAQFLPQIDMNIPVQPNQLVREEQTDDSGKIRRGKVLYSSFQSNELTKRFLKNEKMPNKKEREVLGRSINLTQEQIKRWFENMRRKKRKMDISNELAKKSPV